MDAERIRSSLLFLRQVANRVASLGGSVRLFFPGVGRSLLDEAVWITRAVERIEKVLDGKEDHEE